MERAIGVIDSGVGGLTVAHELMRQLPNERIIYLGDTKRCPYGPRSKTEIQQYTTEMVEFLIHKQIKMIVVACNTATAFALEKIKKEFPIPVLGVIQPGARAAIKATKTNCIGVIGTEGTIRSNAYPNTLHQINNSLRVNVLACSLFVPMVEKGITEGVQAEKVIRESLLPFIHTHSFDTLILGCTHYPLLHQTIQRVIGEKFQIISSSEETARETSILLEMHQLLNTKERDMEHHFYTTGDLNVFRTISKAIFSKDIPNLKPVHIERVII